MPLPDIPLPEMGIDCPRKGGIPSACTNYVDARLFGEGRRLILYMQLSHDVLPSTSSPKINR